MTTQVTGSGVTLGSGGAITFPDSSTQNTAATGFGFKNRIINGSMMIDQRNDGASVTIPANSTTYTVDRWNAYATQASKFTVQQTPSATETGYATRVGAGFTNYLACTSSASTSVGSSDYYVVNQRIEGLNISDLAWGTANAKTVTLSALVYSSLTGTFGGAIQNSAQDRSYPFSFTISSANTWTQVSVTITGDTSGTWLTTNGIGMRVFFNLGSGSTYSGTSGSWAGTPYFAPTGATQVVATSGATFYITGVQLEKGSTATSFDYRPYGTELALCQRYYQVTDSFLGVAASSTTMYGSYTYPVVMRAAPSILATGVLRITDGYSADFAQSSASAVINSGRVSAYGVSFDAANFTGMTQGRMLLSKQASSNNLAMSAEL